MKRFQVFIAFILVVAGCKEISYREPQPKGIKPLTEIPSILRGKYLLPDDNRAHVDTLVVESQGYYATSDKGDKRMLGDSVMLKFHKDYYFININDNPEWLLRLVKREPNGDLSYYMLYAEEKDFNALLRDLSKEIKIDSTIVAGEKLYQIDPSPKQLMKLVEKGLYKKTVTLKKLE